MSPRRNYPRGRRPGGADDDEQPLRPSQHSIESPPGWQVRIVQPAAALKAYRCPPQGCNQEIRPGTLNVVAWRNDDVETRRHWHKPCWDRFARAQR